MLKKQLKAFFVIAITAGGSIGLVELIDYPFAKSYQSNSLLSVTIEGAVYQPGEYQVLSNTTYQTALQTAHPKTSLDWEQVDKQQKINKITSIYAPYKPGTLPKFNFRNGANDEEIAQLNVNSTVKKEIKILFQNNRTVSWADIDSIPGVGEKTLENLKNQIEL